MADALWELVKLKNGASKAPKKSSKSIFDKPWTKEAEGLTPTQSWLHWMNENALRVKMGIPLLALPDGQCAWQIHALNSLRLLALR